MKHLLRIAGLLVVLALPVDVSAQTVTPSVTHTDTVTICRQRERERRSLWRGWSQWTYEIVPCTPEWGVPDPEPVDTTTHIPPDTVTVPHDTVSVPHDPPADTTTHGDPPADTTTHGDPPVDTVTHGDPPPDTTTHGDPPVDTVTHGDPPADTTTHGDPPVDPPPADTTTTPTDPNPGSIAWFCDWSMSTAATQAALRGRVQTGAGGNECFGEFTTTPTKLFEFLDVIPNPGLGFPASMQNVLRVAVGDYPSLLGSPMLKANDVIPTPAIGESVFFRTYDHLAASPGDQLNIHVLHVGTQDRNASPYTMRWFASGNVQNDGTFFFSIDPQFQTGNMGRGQGRFINNAQQGQPQRSTITKVNQTFRREWRITRTGANTATYSVRVYNSAGQLVADDNNYWCTGSETGGCFNGNNWLQERLGQNPVTIEDWNKLRGLELGNNGSTPDDPAARRYWYWGGIAVRVSANANDWIGTYPAGREGN